MIKWNLCLLKLWVQWLENLQVVRVWCKCLWYVHMSMQVYAFMSVHAEARAAWACDPSIGRQRQADPVFHFIFLRQGLSLSQWHTVWATWTGQKVVRICLSLASRARVTGLSSHVQLLCGCWQFQFTSSHLHGKCLYIEPFFQALLRKHLKNKKVFVIPSAPNIRFYWCCLSEFVLTYTCVPLQIISVNTRNSTGHLIS